LEYFKLEKFLSQPRLNKFLTATGNSKTKAQKLYRINLRVAQSFYPILNLFEIFLRNTMNQQIASHFVDSNCIENCANLIISTKKHEILNTQNQDNAYLLDFDLAILGTTWETYESYTQKIRAEYSMFPDLMYKKVRKKVLQHFLERPRIYYTEKYHDLWEANARKNIQKELTLL
jgi:hypothetical protein